MKVAQNDETNQDTQPVRQPHIPSIENTQFSPFGSFVRKREPPGILSRLFSPSSISPPTALGYSQHRYLSCHASLCICLHCNHCFFPILSSVDYETEAAAGAPIDYVVDDPYLPEQPGKRPLVTRYRLFFSLLLALEQCSMLLLSVNPILMHSLSFLLLLLPLPAILNVQYRMPVFHQWPYILVRLPCYTIGP